MAPTIFNSDIPNKTRRALLAAFLCFLVVNVFIAAAAGLADWVSTSSITKYVPYASKDIADTSIDMTKVLKSDVGINGRVVDTTTFLISLFQTSVPANFYGSFKCELVADWNFWLRKKDLRCYGETDREMDKDRKTYADAVCKSWCTRQLYEYRNLFPTCQALEKLKEQSKKYVQSDDVYYDWLERSVCSGAKGIFAMMVLALISAISGMFMACLGARKPVLVLIPGALCAFFLALAVVSYGGAISSAYPDSSDNLLDVRIQSMDSVKQSLTSTSNVQTGFGLAIAAAVLSLVSSALGWVGRFLPKDTELQVVSAVPVQIYTDNNGAEQEAQDIPVVEAVAVPVADMIASANVVFDDDGGGQTNESHQRPTPHGESRIVAVDPAPSANGGAPTPRADGAASAPPMPSTEVHVDAVDVRIDGAPLVSID